MGRSCETRRLNTRWLGKEVISEQVDSGGERPLSAADVTSTGVGKSEGLEIEG